MNTIWRITVAVIRRIIIIKYFNCEFSTILENTWNLDRYYRKSTNLFPSRPSNYLMTDHYASTSFENDFLRLIGRIHGRNSNPIK